LALVGEPQFAKKVTHIRTSLLLILPPPQSARIMGSWFGSPCQLLKKLRAAEKRVQMILETLRKANALDPNRLSDELEKATDEYARLVRELKLAHASFLARARL